jgi:hypothetical protein
MSGVERMREALEWALDEIDVLSNMLVKWAYPQGMAMVGREDQFDNYRAAVAERSAARSEHQEGKCPVGKQCHPADPHCIFPKCQPEHQSAGRDSVLEEAAKICDGYYAKPYDQFDRGFAAACKSLANHFRSLKQEGGER